MPPFSAKGKVDIALQTNVARQFNKQQLKLFKLAAKNKNKFEKLSDVLIAEGKKYGSTARRAIIKKEDLEENTDVSVEIEGIPN